MVLPSGEADLLPPSNERDSNLFPSNVKVNPLNTGGNFLVLSNFTMFSNIDFPSGIQLAAVITVTKLLSALFCEYAKPATETSKKRIMKFFMAFLFDQLVAAGKSYNIIRIPFPAFNSTHEPADMIPFFDQCIR